MNAPAAPQKSFNSNRPKTVYTTVKDFVDDETKVAVRLQRSNDYPRPRYSLQVGRLGDGDRLLPFLNVRIEARLGKVQTMSTFSSVVEALLLQAEEYIHNEAQHTEDQVLDSQIARDEKFANRGKPQTKVTGKTERERNKRKGGAAA